MSARQIADAIDADISRVCHSLKKLAKNNYVNFIELDRIAAAEFLGLETLRRRMKFYFRIDITSSVALQVQVVDLHLQ